MTLADIKTAFKDYRYYYGSAPVGTKLPYLVGLGSASDNFAADNKVYSKLNSFQLEFYSLKKDETTEGAIEAILDNLGAIYDKTESFDEDGTFYLIIYTFWR